MYKRLLFGVYFWLVLAAMCDAAMDVRRDYPTDTIFYRGFSGWMADWYIGGNEDYSWPIKDFIPWDFWHSAKHVRNISIILSMFYCLVTFENRYFLTNSFSADATYVPRLLRNRWKFLLYWYSTFTITFIIFYKIIWRL